MKTLKYLAIAAAALLAGACTQDAIDELSGQYAPPTPVNFTAASDNGSVKDNGKRIFSVAMTNAAGDRMDVQFVGDKYFLHAAAFTPTTSDNLKNGTYLTDASTFTYAGGQPQAIDHGQIVLAKDDDNYTLSGNIWLADNSVVKLGGAFTLHYEPDPEPVALTKVLSVTNNVPNGTKSVSLQLATADITSAFDPMTWSTTYSGTGNYLAVDFYSEDGTLAPGVYAPADANAMTPFTYGKGWDPGDLWGIGMVFTNWGTCWWTVDNGATSAVHIEEGNIEVALAGSTFTITYNYGGLYFQFVGAIEGLGGAPVEYVELTKLLDLTNNVPNGTPSITVKLGTENITASAGAWGTEIGGDGNYIAIDFYSEDGTLAPGVYSAAESAEMGAGTFGKGWDPGDIFGWGIDFTNWGTCWFTREGGAESGVHVDDGTISVALEGDVYTITIETSATNAKYSGTLNL